MNYTSAIVAVVVLIGTVAWYVEVRHKYRGPASAVHVEEDSAKTAEV